MFILALFEPTHQWAVQAFLPSKYKKEKEQWDVRGCSGPTCSIRCPGQPLHYGHCTGSKSKISISKSCGNGGKYLGFGNLLETRPFISAKSNLIPLTFLLLFLSSFSFWKDNYKIIVPIYTCQHI